LIYIYMAIYGIGQIPRDKTQGLAEFDLV